MADEKLVFTEDTLSYYTSKLKTLISGKVDKVSGKGLSTKDYTEAEKTKLAGIAAGAQVNSITGIKGSAESSYRTGNVNLTPANIGALASNANAASASKLNNTTAIGSATQPVYFTGGGIPAPCGYTIEKNVPADAKFTDTNTHYNTGLKVGASARATANAAASNGDVHLNVLDDSTVKDSHKIIGTGATTVVSDADGVITINSVNTTYSPATTSANGLMTSTMVTTLNTVNTNLSSHTANTGNPHSVTKSQIGLGNVENKSSATIRGELSSSNVTTALGYTPLNSALKGAKSGLAELDANGYVPSSQLPSYVDDVLEYSAKSSFPTTGATGKIYVDLSNGKIYRWSGSAYVEISASLALGETSSTAYRGDRGKTAYDHSQITGANPHAITPAIIGALASNGTAVKATADASGQTIASTYIKGLSVSGKTITYTFGNGTTGTITTQDTVYTLPTASSTTLGGVKTTSTVTSTSGLTACPIIGGVPYYKNSTYSLSSFGITASAAELNVLDGITATVTELNYTDGVTSNIQTQLNNKAAKATTLGGYGITNAYTKAEIDAYSFITTAEIDTICNG